MVPESYNLNWSDWMKIKARGAPCFRRTLTQSVRRRPVRELLGKIPTKDPDVIQEIYLSETVYCRECTTMAAVPVGIEVVTVKTGKTSKKVLRHEYYCRAHGFVYEIRVQGLPIRPRRSA